MFCFRVFLYAYIINIPPYFQTDLSRVMIGKYERGDAVPSIEAAKKIADTFGVSLDYLVGEGVNSSFDKKTVKRLQDIEKLQPEEREHIFALMDAFLFKCQVQNSLSA
nr:helix-turn-helix domain-containing protein [Echinicola pacifica]